MPSITEIVNGIADKAGDEMNAMTRFDGLPSQEPAYLPAVIVEWKQTTVNGNNYATQQGKRLISNADVRVHQGSIIWLYSASTNAVYETAKSYGEAEKLLSIFDRDIRLEDATGKKLADRVNITQVQPIELQWGQTIYFGVQADWEAQELT